MAEEQRMNFYRTFYDLTTLLPERERQKVNTAMLDYFFEGTEPTGLSASGMKVFRGCEGRISKSRTNAANVSSRYLDSKATNDATKPDTNDATKPATNAPTKCDTELPANAHTKQIPEREGEREKEGEGVKEGGVAPTRLRFSPPSREEVAAYASEYCAKQGLSQSGFDPERFIDHYASNGWRVGRTPMKDWKATVRNWIRKDCKPMGGGSYAQYDR